MKILIIAVLMCAGLRATTDVAQVPNRVDPITLMQFKLLEKEAENLRLRVCSEAEIKHTECRVDWQTGIVSKVGPPAIKGETTPAKATTK